MAGRAEIMGVSERFRSILRDVRTEGGQMARDGYADLSGFLKELKALDVEITPDILAEAQKRDVRFTKFHVRDEFATFTEVVRKEGATVGVVLKAVDLGAHYSRTRKERVAGTTIFEAWAEVGAANPEADKALLDATGGGDQFSQLIELLAKKITPGPEVPSE